MARVASTSEDEKRNAPSHAPVNAVLSYPIEELVLYAVPHSIVYRAPSALHGCPLINTSNVLVSS